MILISDKNGSAIEFLLLALLLGRRSERFGWVKERPLEENRTASALSSEAYAFGHSFCAVWESFGCQGIACTNEARGL
jgi:hypothetical protein